MWKVVRIAKSEWVFPLWCLDVDIPANAHAVESQPDNCEPFSAFGKRRERRPLRHSAEGPPPTKSSEACRLSWAATV